MSWRLIPYSESDGPWNMALDEAILESFIAQTSPATLRFYGWTGPWVSVGRLQPVDSVPEGWGTCLVRRPTGGRAVSHGQDITFSIVVSAMELGTPVAESYRKTSTAVLDALNALGVRAEMACNRTAARDVRKIGACFGLTTECELVVGRRKIFGSAQLRRSGAVLQQNSLVVPEGIIKADLMAAIACSIANMFTINLREDSSTNNELKMARLLADNKYAGLRKYGKNL